MRHLLDSTCKCSTWFQSTHSLRSATGDLGTDDPDPTVSIHALLAECDLWPLRHGDVFEGFNPRTPCGVRPVPASYPSCCLRFQSTHSLRSATFSPGKYRPGNRVSIHALLAECDATGRESETVSASFNPRTPCGVRLASFGIVNVPCGFNPRTPCGVRPHHGQSRDAFLGFQSTHSLRSATQLILLDVKSLNVSIHALLAECDLNEAVIKYFVDGFNPRTPCGVRQTSSSRSTTIVLFQSTHSLRSATFVKIWDCPSTMFQSTHSLRSATRLGDVDYLDGVVSIHALLAECDAGFFPEGGAFLCFNPRTPCGVRRHRLKNPIKNQGFQSTHSLRSATALADLDMISMWVSIHALLAECDPRWRI